MAKRKRRRKKSFWQRNKGIIIIAALIVIILGTVIGVLIAENNRVYEKVTVEAGIEVKVEDLLKKEDAKAYITEDSSPIDVNTPGNYEIKVHSGLWSHKVTIVVEDTTAPELTVKDATTTEGVAIDVAAFVENVSDVTQVTTSFKETPDTSTVGSQSVTILAVDAAGNDTEQTANLTVLSKDTEPPVITGAKNQTFYVGETISYKSFLSATDNNPEGLEFTIDSSNVNVNVAGDYTVTCKAVDAAGNVAEESFVVTIVKGQYTEAEVFARADAILKDITTSSMTNNEKCEAIYWYIRKNMKYHDSNDMPHWIQSAGQGLFKKQGDCYTYACLSKVLLTRAGITNMDIGRIPEGNETHYWNLVDTGDGHGWYHFDATPRVSGNPTICLWTDAQIKEYSDANHNCHNYDRSAYPKIP